MSRDDALRLHADRLWALIERRAQHGSDTDRIDAEIWELFGERWVVMFTDLSGFSRQVERFGILHFLQVIHEQRKLLDPVILANDGILVKSEADSLLLLFRAPASALRCALAMQNACRLYNERRRPEEQVLLCVGIGYGEMLRVGSDDVWGREVNAASKLGEDTARAGQILVTQAFRDVLGEERGREFELIGEVAGFAANYRYTGS